MFMLKYIDFYSRDMDLIFGQVLMRSGLPFFDAYYVFTI
jgi:hypothetical protein